MKKANKQSGFIGNVIIACIIIIMVLGILYFTKQALMTSGPASTATSTSASVQSASTTPAVVGQDIGINDVDNGTYKVWGETVTMVGGRYQNGTSPATTKNFIRSSISVYAIGDINGDGHDDALVQTATSLGNDYRYELHSLVKQNSAVASTLLKIPVTTGDVRTVDDISINTKGIISLVLSIVPPGGASCCPTIHTTNQYRFDGSSLILVATSTKK